MPLSDIIRQRIQAEGPISFHDFMEMALYFPGLGYYTSAQDKIGADGDFYTSSNLTSAFGATIARQLEQMWEMLGKNKFTIVEFGAGTGMLCHDILDYLKHNKELYGQLEYCIIEKSEIMRDKQKKHLHEHVSWYNSIHDIPKITGCILSNELLDNFSVHQVIMEDELMEVFVDYSDGFVELLQPASKELATYFSELDIVLPEGFRTEINLEAVKWIEQVAAGLRKGYVITIDYGYASQELYQQRRANGTLVCYHKHAVHYNPFENIGEQDITSHVNFSALCHWGNKYGLHCSGLTNQAAFLLSLGFKELLRNSLNTGENLLALVKKEAALSFTLLVDMGTRFKVLIQRKGVGNNQLTGLAAL